MVVGGVVVVVVVLLLLLLMLVVVLAVAGRGHILTVAVLRVVACKTFNLC